MPFRDKKLTIETARGLIIEGEISGFVLDRKTSLTDMLSRRGLLRVKAFTLIRGLEIISRSGELRLAKMALNIALADSLVKQKQQWLTIKKLVNCFQILVMAIQPVLHEVDH